MTKLLWGYVAAGALLACGSGGPGGFLFTDPAAGAGGASGPGAAGGGAGGAGGQSCSLPADVQQVLQTYCTTCHGDPPTGAPNALVTYAQLAAQDATQATMTVAQYALKRMQSTTATMPPGAPVPAAALATFAAWVNGGAQPVCVATDGGAGAAPGAGTPGGSSGGGVYGTPSVCTSNATNTSGSGSGMRPGNACIACHASSDAPRFAIAGTVYPTAHEPDDCKGASGLTVVITDANGLQTSLTTNSSGNFSSSRSIALPYTAKVVGANGAERAMVSAQTSGDCNTCHTEGGATGAPGRVMAP